ncbi:MAG: DPP IV N-terminal domain-containing protein [Gemmatimonadota bacterium]
MTRVFVVALLLCPILACDHAPETPLAQAGLFTTVGGPRSWRLEPPPPDTLHTVARRVWYGESASFLSSPSPDGARFAYQDPATGDIAIWDLATGQSRRLTHNAAAYEPGYGMYPRLSPDGKRVAYAWYSNETPTGWQLRVADVEGSEPALLHAADWINPEDWSPDGTRILALQVDSDGAHQMALVSAEDGSVRVLKSGVRGDFGTMRFSPDGRSVLYDLPSDPENEDSRDLYLIPVDGGQERQLVDHPANDKVLGWAPDGAHILFESDRTGTPGAWLLPVARGQASGPPVLVKPDFWQAMPMEFTGDGRFVYGVLANSRGIHIASFAPRNDGVVGEPEPGTQPSLGVNTWPDWSPDSRQLAFLSRRSSLQNTVSLAIRFMDTEEERYMRLPRSVGYPSQPLWLPDGRTILLRAGGHVHRVDIWTAEVEELFSVGGDIYSYDVTPDGSAVVYSHEAEGEGGRAVQRIVSRDLASGDEREIYRLVADGMEQLREIVLSPDGKTIAVWRVGNTDMSVFLLPIEGGEARELVRGFAGAPTWTPDGRALLVRVYNDPPSTRGGTHLARVTVESGEVEDLGLGMQSWGQINLSPDGRHLAFIDGAMISEVWVMEGFLPQKEGE